MMTLQLLLLLFFDSVLFPCRSSLFFCIFFMDVNCTLDCPKKIANHQCVQKNPPICQQPSLFLEMVSSRYTLSQIFHCDLFLHILPWHNLYNMYSRDNGNFMGKMDIENSKVSMSLLDDFDGNKHLLVSKFHREITIE